MACIWTIKHHDYLAGQIRIYVWSASATILFLSFANLIHITTALKALLAGSMGIAAFLWIMILWRKERLLKINDPVLRQKAYTAMLELVASKNINSQKTGTVKNRYWIGNLFYKK